MLSKSKPLYLLIIISCCHSRLWIAVISIDIITSTRFLQTISTLINFPRHCLLIFTFVKWFRKNKTWEKRILFLLVFVGWIVAWLRIVVITIDIRTCLWFLEIRFCFQTCNMQDTAHRTIWSTYIVLNQIRMIFLDAIVKDGYDNIFTSETKTPGARYIHCTAMFILIMLLTRTYVCYLNREETKLTIYHCLSHSGSLNVDDRNVFIRW